MKQAEEHTKTSNDILMEQSQQAGLREWEQEAGGAMAHVYWCAGPGQPAGFTQRSWVRGSHNPNSFEKDP